MTRRTAAQCARHGLWWAEEVGPQHQGGSHSEECGKRQARHRDDGEGRLSCESDGQEATRTKRGSELRGGEDGLSWKTQKPRESGVRSTAAVTEVLSWSHSFALLRRSLSCSTAIVATSGPSQLTAL